MQEPTLQHLFTKHSAEVVVLAPGSSHCIIVPDVRGYGRKEKTVQLGFYMAEATRLRFFPFMKKL
jgi:hypothetical protein